MFSFLLNIQRTRLLCGYNITSYCMCVRTCMCVCVEYIWNLSGWIVRLWFGIIYSADVFTGEWKEIVVFSLLKFEEEKKRKTKIVIKLWMVVAGNESWRFSFCFSNFDRFSYQFFTFEEMRSLQQCNTALSRNNSIFDFITSFTSYSLKHYNVVETQWHTRTRIHFIQFVQPNFVFWFFVLWFLRFNCIWVDPKTIRIC